MDFATRTEVETLVTAAGGPTELARRMSSDSVQFSRQRVANWMMHGRIPPMVCRAYERLFKRILARASQEA